MTLSDTQIRSLKGCGKNQKLSDGNGLHLFLTAKGAKHWRLAYRFNGKQKTLSFGSYPAVGLAQARRKRDDAKEEIAKGLDPSDLVRQAKRERIDESDNTFGSLAEEFLAKCVKEGKAETTLKKKRWLLDQAKSYIFHRPIAELSAAEILVPLRRVESAGNYETARRLRAEIGQVCRYAIATARATNDPTFGLRGALVTPTVTHRAAFTDREGFGGLLRSIWEYGGSPETRAALKLMAYLYPRPGELRMAEWSEFDLEKRVWTMPKERTKMRREHRKPLPAEAIEILEELRLLTGYRDLVFPSYQSPKRPMSENTLNSALRRMGFTKEEATAHGFRASASSLLNESGKWSPDAIEAELAHIGADEVRNAYHRSNYWDERVRMTEWWAGFIRRCF